VLDIDYSEGQHPNEVGDPKAAGRWKLNLVIPAGCAQPVPVFVDNPGSAWMSTNTKTATHAITNYCYAFVGMNASASSLCKFPCSAHDMRAAIRWIRAHANGWVNPVDHKRYTWSLDPNRIAVSGFSSGGWHAAFKGLTNGASSFDWRLPSGKNYHVDLEGTLGPWEGKYSSDVQAVVPLHPPTDFSLMNEPYSGKSAPSALDHDSATSPESSEVGCTVGDSRDDGNPLYSYDPLCEAKVQSANPIRYITHDDPPVMDFHGSSDSLVPHGQSVYLYEALRDNCNNVRFYSMDGQNHAPVYVDLPVSAPYIWFQSVNCGAERIAPGPPEQTVLLPEGTPYTRYAATWAGVAAFLDENMREKTPPDLRVDATKNTSKTAGLLAARAVTVDVQTNEASSYDAVASVNGVQIGKASVDLYHWGAGYPKGKPAPYASTIRIPISNTRILANGGRVSVSVKATDRVGNRITKTSAFTLVGGAGNGTTNGSGVPTSTTQLPATGGGAAAAGAVVLLALAWIAWFVGRRRSAT
jgi:acetyl esterase/lipase